MNIFKAVIGLFTGGSSAVDKGIDIISEKVTDVDKRNDMIGNVVMKYLESPPTIPIIDGIHKLGRQAMMAVLAYWYYQSWKAGNPIPIEDFMIIAGGPALYTVLKGTGRV